jgi:hypothetical protein
MQLAPYGCCSTALPRLLYRRASAARAERGAAYSRSRPSSLRPLSTLSYLGCRLPDLRLPVYTETPSGHPSWPRTERNRTQVVALGRTGRALLETKLPAGAGPLHAATLALHPPHPRPPSSCSHAHAAACSAPSPQWLLGAVRGARAARRRRCTMQAQLYAALSSLFLLAPRVSMVLSGLMLSSASSLSYDSLQVGQGAGCSSGRSASPGPYGRRRERPGRRACVPGLPAGHAARCRMAWRAGLSVLDRAQQLARAAGDAAGAAAPAGGGCTARAAAGAAPLTCWSSAGRPSASCAGSARSPGRGGRRSPSCAAPGGQTAARCAP